MDFETFSKKSIRRSKNVETVGVARDLGNGDMGWPYFRRSNNHIGWRIDQPIFRLVLIGIIIIIWALIIFVIGVS